MTDAIDACRVCGSACSHCADRRAAAKTRAELDALREPPTTRELRVPLGELTGYKSKSTKP